MSKDQQRLDEYQDIAFYKKNAAKKEKGFSPFEVDGTPYFAYFQEGKIALISQSYKAVSGRDNGIKSTTKNMKSEKNFRFHKHANGKHYYGIVAGNGQEVAVSTWYASEAAARASAGLAMGKRSAVSKAKSAPKAKPAAKSKPANKAKSDEDNYQRLEFYTKQTQGKPKNGIEKFKGEDGQYYFVYNENGKVALISEGYPTAAAQDTGAKSVRNNIKNQKRYQFRKLRNGKHDYKLKAGNGREIARSVWYGSAAAATAGAAYLMGKRKRAVKAAAPIAATTIAASAAGKAAAKPKAKAASKPAPAKPAKVKTKAKAKSVPVTGAAIAATAAATAAAAKAAQAKPAPVAASPAAAVPAAAKAGGGFAWLKWLLPLLLLLLLLFGLSKCLAPKVPTIDTAAIAAEAKAKADAATAAAKVKADEAARLAAEKAAQAKAAAASAAAATVAAAETVVEAAPSIPAATPKPVSAPSAGWNICGPSSVAIFNVPTHYTPKPVNALGTYPEFGDSHGLTPRQFRDKLASRAAVNGYDRTYLNYVATSMGYANFAAIPASAFSEEVLPAGTTGLLGFGEQHAYAYHRLNTSQRDRQAFRIESLNGQVVHFMKTCGNYMYACQ